MSIRRAVVACLAILALAGCTDTDVVVSRTGGLTGVPVEVVVTGGSQARITTPGGVRIEALDAAERDLLAAVVQSAGQAGAAPSSIAAADAYRYTLTANGTTWTWTDADEPAQLTPARELLEALLDQ